jgi:hypothetical protein
LSSEELALPDLASCLNTPGTILFGVDEAPPAPLSFGLPDSQDFRGFEVELIAGWPRLTEPVTFVAIAGSVSGCQ